MAGLKQIKSKIRSTEKTRKVTKAMEAVSAAKMRKAQLRAISGRAYARAAASILGRVSGSRGMAAHPLTQERPIKNALYIVFTSDKGLAGALNSAVLRATAADIASRGLSTEQVKVIAVGRKANEFFSRRGYVIESFHENADDAISSELISQIVAEAAARFTSGQADHVAVAYQNFRTTFEQRPTLRTMFPLSLAELQKVVHDIVPARGRFADTADGMLTPSLYTIEPSEEEILGQILPRLASVFVYHALLETKASEHSARMVAMKSASDKGAEMQHALTLQYNKARQAAITREVSEITGGMEAMAG